MPLFFLTLVFLFKTELDWITLFKKKISRILIPYATFCILTIILRTAFATFTNSRAPIPVDAVYRFFTGGYCWFLYSLFIMMVVCWLVRKILCLGVIMLFQIVTSLLYNDIQPVILQKSIHYIFFFVVDIFLRDYYNNIHLNNTVHN